MIWILGLAVLVFALWPRPTSRVYVEILAPRHRVRIALPPRPLPRRYRPMMIYNPAHRCWKCPCGSVETEHARAARPPVEHACPLETWS